MNLTIFTKILLPKIIISGLTLPENETLITTFLTNIVILEELLFTSVQNPPPSISALQAEFQNHLLCTSTMQLKEIMTNKKVSQSYHFVSFFISLLE